MIRDARCCVCEAANAKYRCPACERRTCCLNCVALHKEKWQCSGKRPRNAFVSVKGFTDQKLISDLRFLDEVHRVKEANWRNLRRVALVLRPQETPPHQRKLRYEARQRGMQLHFLPRGMSRSKCNSSWFDHKRQEICWDIDWIIPFLPGRFQIRKRRVPESETVASALNTALSSSKFERLSEETLSVVTKRHRCPSNEAVYFNFEMEATLKSQLQGKELVEYPVLIVLRERDRSMYHIQSNT